MNTPQEHANAKTIKRFSVDEYLNLREFDNGIYVLYSDHAAELHRANEEVERLKGQFQSDGDRMAHLQMQLTQALANNEKITAENAALREEVEKVNRRVEVLDLQRQRHGIDMYGDPVRLEEVHAIRDIARLWNDENIDKARAVLIQFAATRRTMNEQWAQIIVANATASYSELNHKASRAESVAAQAEASAKEQELVNEAVRADLTASRARCAELEWVLKEVNEALNTCKDHNYSDGMLHHQSYDTARVGDAHIKARAALSRTSEEGKGRRIPFAFCCSGDPATCDCVNKDHGTALDGSKGAK